jgi:hypothetical protein
VFLDNSRYFNQPTMNVTLSDARTIAALQPRALPAPTGAATDLKRTDRLDIIALRQYQDGTRFWHIADANSLTDSRQLTEPRGDDATTSLTPVITVPDK